MVPKSSEEDNAGAPPQRGFYYGWAIAGTLAVTETVSWGVLYYAFAVFLVPMQDELGWSRAAVTGLTLWGCSSRVWPRPWWATG